MTEKEYGGRDHQLPSIFLVFHIGSKKKKTKIKMSMMPNVQLVTGSIMQGHHSQIH